MEDGDDGGAPEAEVEDAGAGEGEMGLGLEEAEDEGVGGIGVGKLAGVERGAGDDVVAVEVDDVPAVEAVDEGTPEAVEAVGDAVDVADFLAVVGGNGKLDNLGPGLVGLEEDMGVEVPLIDIGPEGDASEEAGGVGAVAGVELAHVHAGKGILDPGEEDVGDELVLGHAAGEGVAAVYHARADDDVGILLDEGTEHIGEELGGVLSIAMEHDDGVETVVDGILVAELLIAAVAAIGAVAEDLELVIGVGVGEGLAGGFVSGAVVDDVDDLDGAPDVIGNAREGFLNEEFGVVGNDENAESAAMGVEGRAIGGRWGGRREIDGCNHDLNILCQQNVVVNEKLENIRLFGKKLGRFQMRRRAGVRDAE